jgi:acyl-CoA synthetase (AMP-forming)/AMP-acid ligase II
VLTLAILKIAVPIVLMPSSSTIPEAVALAKLSDMTHLFVSPSLISHGLAIADALRIGESKVVLLHGHLKGRRNLTQLVHLGLSKGLKVKTQSVNYDTPAYLMFSSGTGGLPKGAANDSKFHCLVSDLLFGSCGYNTYKSILFCRVMECR